MVMISEKERIQIVAYFKALPRPSNDEA